MVVQGPKWGGPGQGRLQTEGCTGPSGWGWGEDGTEWRSCITTVGALCLEPAVGDSVNAEPEARLRAGLCS